MKKIKSIIVSLLLPIAPLLAEETTKGVNLEHKSIGTIVSLRTDFDIYKIRHGNREPYTYSYMIMPAPEAGIGGRFYTYLGRMPAGTLLEITSTESSAKGKDKNRLGYKLRPLSLINERIKGNTSRKVHTPESPLEEEIFTLGSVGVGLGIYEKGSYSNGTPKLNDTWFEIINIHE